MFIHFIIFIHFIMFIFFSKLFERVIFNQLHDHFNLHNLYFNSQYGFRKKHSTEFAVLELLDKTIKHMNSGAVPISIFLEIKCLILLIMIFFWLN